MNETELLFTEILKCDKLYLYQNRSLRLNKDKSLIASSVLKRRIVGEPLQYILGRAEFMGLEFKVNSDTFIPRPETEILVETALKYVKSLASSSEFLVDRELQYNKSRIFNILDLGTGSGCIAISLAKFLVGVKVTAIDISPEGLRVAKDNARLNGVEMDFMQSNLFDSCDLRPATCDLIVSNPPYIPSEEIKDLQPEIQYEPRIALDGGRDGLDFYRKIINNSPPYLKEDGFLILEIGFNQRAAVEDMLKSSGNFSVLEVAKDYSNIDRVIVGQRI